MTISEIKNALNEYATDDIETVKANGASAITDTKHGCLHLSYEDGEFWIHAQGQELLNTTDEDEVKSFLIESYSIEIAK